MTQEEQIRLYRLMEKLNWFFHQEMHYLNRDIAEKTARECYPEIREFTLGSVGCAGHDVRPWRRHFPGHGQSV